MKSVRSVAKHSLIITSILILSKSLGFVRELIVVFVFGATRESDIFKIATTIPSVIFSCISAALVITFIPVFSDVKKNKEEANRFFNNIVNIVLILCIALAIIGIIASPILVKLFASGFNDADLARTVSVTKIVLPCIIFLGLSGLYTGYLQSYGTFTQPAMTGIAADIIIVIGIVVFRQYGIYAAVISFLLGSIAQVAIQRPFMKNYKRKFFIDLHDPNIRRMVILGLPILISTAVSQINLMVDRTFASHLIAGSISQVDYASKISTIINQVFIVSVTTVLYPMLTERISENDKSGFDSLFAKTVNLVFVIAIPLIAGMVVLSGPLVKLLLEHGKFDSNSAIITANCLKFLAVGTLGYGLLDSLDKVFFSVKQTLVPMVNGFILVAFNVLLIFLFVPKYGVVGLAMATTVSTISIALLQLIELKLLLKTIHLHKIFNVFVRCLISGIIMGVIVYFAYALLSKAFISNGILILSMKLIIVTSIGAITYYLFLKLFKIEEINFINLNFIKRKFRKI